MGADGYFTAARLQRAPIRLHWSLLPSIIVLTRFRFAPGAWLGIVVLLVVHELGHALLVRGFGLSLEAIELHGFGGECRFSGFVSPWRRSIIAWGGVVAQAALLPLGFVIAPSIEVEFLRSCLLAFGVPNCWMIALNLLPIGPLDGRQAWRLPALALKRIRGRSRTSRRRNESSRSKTADADARRVREAAAPSPPELPDEVSAQLARAVRRALDERERRR